MMVELEKVLGMDVGWLEWVDGNFELIKVLCFFFYYFKGEGYFIVKFVKNGEEFVFFIKKNKKKKGCG